MTLERCQMPHAEVDGNLLILSGTIALRLAVMPPFVRTAWNRAITHAGLRCRPTLFAVESAAGAGGFHVPGLVAVGLQDLERLADALVAAGGYRFLTEARAQWYRRHDPARLITAADRLRAAAEHLIHHELGHALAHQGGWSRQGPAEEAQADQIAGILAARVGSRPDLGRAFFRAIGCHRAPFCSHPSADDRVRAFDAGYQRELGGRRAAG